MKRIGLFFFVAGVLMACETTPDAGPFAGAWQMVSATYTDADTSLTFQRDQVKILTAQHFAFGRDSPEGAYAGGGRYSYDLDAATYTEYIDYHEDSTVAGTTVSFTFEMEGDTLWRHMGEVGGVRLEEIWRRIPEE